MPSRFTRLALLIALTAAVSGCLETTSPPLPPVTAMAQAKGILVTNNRAEPVYYGAYEPLHLAYTDYLPVDCAQPGACPTLDGHSQVLVSWRKVLGFVPTRSEYVVSWTSVQRTRFGSVPVSSIGVTPEP
jgi:hypothetical protein